MLGFRADAWLNNTGFQGKSITEFLKYETTRLFFSCGAAVVRAIVVAAWAKTLFQSLPVEEFSTVIPGKEINP
jgi:hypothetical protein